MTAETWEIKNVSHDPLSNTRVFCQNEGDNKWIFVRSSYYNTLYVKLWLNSYTEETRMEVPAYGIGGFAIPYDYLHGQVQIGISANDSDFTWTVHNYHNGGTS